MPPKIETMEEIQGNLSKYGNRFHVNNVLEKIRNVGIDENEGFRFYLSLAIMMSDVEDFHTNTLSVGKIPGLIILMLAIADLSFWTTQG